MPTYKLIATNTVGLAGAASVTLSSIPATYTDLVLKMSFRADGIGSRNRLTFNGSNAANYSERMVYGDGSSVFSTSLSANTRIELIYGTNTNNPSDTFSNIEIYIPNYAGANYKSVSIDGTYENNASAAIMNFNAGLWSLTNAITSITLTPELGNYVQYSTFTLYGISNA